MTKDKAATTPQGLEYFISGGFASPAISGLMSFVTSFFFIASHVSFLLQGHKKILIF